MAILGPTALWLQLLGRDNKLPISQPAEARNQDSYSETLYYESGIYVKILTHTWSRRNGSQLGFPGSSALHTETSGPASAQRGGKAQFVKTHLRQGCPREGVLSSRAMSRGGREPGAWQSPHRHWSPTERNPDLPPGGRGKEGGSSSFSLHPGLLGDTRSGQGTGLGPPVHSGIPFCLQNLLLVPQRLHPGRENSEAPSDCAIWLLMEPPAGGPYGG